MDAKLSPFIKNIPESTSPSGSITMDKEIGSDTVFIEKDTATQSEDNIDDTKLNDSIEEILIQRGEFEAIEKHKAEKGFKRCPRSNKKHDCCSYGRSQRYKCDYCDRKKTRCMDCISITNSSYTMDVKLSPFVRNVPRATSPRKCHTRDTEVGSKTVLKTKDMTTQSNMVEDIKFAVLKQQYILNKEGDYEALEKHNQYCDHKSERDYKNIPASSKEHEDKTDQEYKPTLGNKSQSLFTRKLKKALKRGLAKKTESKSKTDISLGEGTRHLGISIASDPPSGVSTPQSVFSNPFKTDLCKKNDNKVKKKILAEEKEKKKFFSFKKKNKHKDIDEGRMIFKNSFTTGRCEVTNGLMIRTSSKSNNHIHNASEVVKQKENSLQTPPVTKDNIRETLFEKNPTHIDSQNSVKVIWNNKIYTTSSGKVFELMNNVCRKSCVELQSNSEVAQRQIEAWLVLKTNDTQSQKHKLDKTNEKCLEVKVFDENWILDKTKAFCHEIEIILHSNKLANKDIKQDSSEYIRIDIPKGFFVDSDEASNESNNSEQNVSSAEEVYKITEYDTEIGRKEKNVCKSCKKDNIQNIVKVKQKIQDDRERIAKSQIPTVRRDIVLQGSHVIIPRHDFVGVGIINRRDICELPNPCSTQRYCPSVEESERDLQFHRRCRLAKNYLQESYNPETPGIGLISISEYYPFQCCSDISIESYLCNQNEETISCPTVFDNYRHTNSIFEISHISMASFVESCCWYDKLKHTCCNVTKSIKEKRRKEAATNICTRMNPKDSIEVYNRRKFYAISNKSKWKAGVKLQDPCCPNMSDDAKVEGSRSSNDTKCCQQKKRVCLVGSHDIIVRKSSDRMPDGILTFKNNPPCQVKKQEHCRINPTPALEPPSCRKTCEQMENPPCSDSKTSCEEMLLSQCCAGIPVKSSKENSHCTPALCPVTSSQYPEAYKPQDYSAPCNDCSSKTDAMAYPNMPKPLSNEQTACSSCEQSKINNISPDVPTCQQPCPAVSTSCNSKSCPSKSLPCNISTNSTTTTNCIQQPCEISELTKTNQQPIQSKCHSPADEKLSCTSYKEEKKLPLNLEPPICVEVPASGIAPIYTKQSPCRKDSCSEKSSTCNSCKSPCFQHSSSGENVSPCETSCCPGKKALPCDEFPACVKAISCKKSPSQEELTPDILCKKNPCHEILPSEEPLLSEKFSSCKELPTCEELPMCEELPKSEDLCKTLPSCEDKLPGENRTQYEEISNCGEVCSCDTPTSRYKELQSKTCKIPCDTSLANITPACVPCKTMSYTPSRTPSTACTPFPTACQVPTHMPCKMQSPISCKTPSMPYKMPTPMPCKVPFSVPCKMSSCRPGEKSSNIARDELSNDPSLRPCHKQMSITSQKTPSNGFSESRNNYIKPCLKPCTPYPPPCKHILLPPPCATECERYPCSHRFEGIQIRGFPSANRHSIIESSNTDPDTCESCPNESDTCQSCRPCYFTTEQKSHVLDQGQEPQDLCSYAACNPNQHIFNQSQIIGPPSCLQCNASRTDPKSGHNCSLPSSCSHPSPEFSYDPTEYSHNPQFAKEKYVSISANLSCPLKSPLNSAHFISSEAPCLCMNSSYKNDKVESSSATYIASPYLMSARDTLNLSKSSCKATLCTSSQTVSQHFAQVYENSTGINTMHSNYFKNEPSVACKSSSTTTTNTKSYKTPFCYKKLIPPFKLPYLQCRKNNKINLTEEASLLNANRYIDAEQKWIKCESDCAMRELCRRSCIPAPSSSAVHELKRYESSPRSEAISVQNTEPNGLGCSPRSLYPLSPPIYPKSMKLTGVHIRVLPSSKKICSSDCNTWVPARRDDTLALNAEQKITIRFIKDKDDKESITDGLYIEVQDENGITLYERKEKGNYKQSPVCDKSNRLLEDIYKDSNVNRLATSLHGDCDHNNLKQKRSNANIIEIRIKLQLDKSNEAAEKYKLSTEIKGDNKTSGQQISQDAFEVKSEKISCDKCMDNNDDVIIRIIIKTILPRSRENLAKHDYNKKISDQISPKFHSVCTGCSDIIEKDANHRFSVHRETVNLTSVDKIDMHSEDLIRNVILTSDSNDNKTKISTKSYICIIGNNVSKVKTQSIESNTAINQLSITQTHANAEKVQVEIQSRENSTININISNTTNTDKQDLNNGNLIEDQYDPVAASYIEFPDIILEILENHYTSYVKQKSESEETIRKRRTRDKKKHLLKNIFEKARKAKRNRKRLKKLRDMLRFILSYDSSDLDVGSSSSTTNNDLERKATCTSLKPNYVTYSGSLNNFYRAEVRSSHTVLSEKTLYKKNIYLTPATTISSKLNSSQNTSTQLPCMCNSVSKNLKLASWISKMGGACYCKKSIIKSKRSIQTCCDLDNSDFIIEHVEIETQNSRNVASKLTRSNVTNNSKITLPDNFNKRFPLREIYTSYNKYLESCVNHRQRCGNRNINRTFDDKNEVILLRTKHLKSSDEKIIKDRQNKEHNFVDEFDILQSNAIKKAVLAIYTEQITTSGRMIAKLPKFVHNTENKLRCNLNTLAANVDVSK